MWVAHLALLELERLPRLVVDAEAVLNLLLHRVLKCAPHRIEGSVQLRKRSKVPKPLRRER
jgi:hypothetical protein